MPLTRMHEDIIIASIELYIDDIVKNEVLTPEQKEQALSLMMAPAVTAEAATGFPPDIVEEIKAINHIYNHECPQNVSESSPYFGSESLDKANRKGEVIYEPNGHGHGIVYEKKGVLNLTRHGGGNPTRDDVRAFIENFINTKAQQIHLPHVHPAQIAAQVTQMFSTTLLRGAPLSNEELIRKINAARDLKTLISTLIQHRQRPSVRQYVAENIESLSERLKADPQSTAQFFMTSYITDILNQKPDIFYSLIREYAKNTDSKNTDSFRLLCKEMQRIRTENNKHYLAFFAFRVALLAREHAGVAINVLLNQNIFKDYLTNNDVIIILENHKTNVNFIQPLVNNFVNNAAFRDIVVRLAEQDVKIANNLLRILKPYTQNISGNTFAKILEPHIVSPESFNKLFDEVDDDFKKLLLFKAGRYSSLVAFYAMKHLSEQMQEFLQNTSIPSSEIKLFQKNEKDGRNLVANQSSGVTSAAAAAPAVVPSRQGGGSPAASAAAAPAAISPRRGGGSLAASAAAAPAAIPPRQGGGSPAASAVANAIVLPSPPKDYGSIAENKAYIKTLLERYFKDLQNRNIKNILFQATLLSGPDLQNVRFGNINSYMASVFSHLNQAETLEELKYLLSNILSAYDLNSHNKVTEIISPEITRALEQHLQAIESRLSPTVTPNHGMRP